MLAQDRSSTRAVFSRAWDKFQCRLPLDGTEKLIVQVAVVHPEYHALLEDLEARDRDYTPNTGQTNPWLHLGMHIAILEQLSIDQPRGIGALYGQIVEHAGDEHTAQHQMMECLGELLWRAQRDGTAPDETAYLRCLQRLAGIGP
jgi:hypothetical protein